MSRNMYLRNPRRRPRMVGAEELTRILSRGGVVAELRGELCVFRTGDSRRMRIGVVRPATLAMLEADGAVRRDDTDAVRYLAGMSR